MKGIEKERKGFGLYIYIYVCVCVLKWIYKSMSINKSK